MPKHPPLKIQMICDGTNIDLTDSPSESPSPLSSELNPSAQIDLLISHLASLSNTVNRNAFCLKELELRTESAQPVENFLQEALCHLPDACSVNEKFAADRTKVSSRKSLDSQPGDQWSSLLAQHKQAVKFLANTCFSKEVKEIREVEKVVQPPAEQIVRTVHLVDEAALGRIALLEQKYIDLLRDFRAKEELHTPRVEKIVKVASPEKEEKKEEEEKHFELECYLKPTVDLLSCKIEELASKLSEVTGKVGILQGRPQLEPQTRPVGEAPADTIRRQMEKSINFLEENLSREQNNLASKVRLLEESLAGHVARLNQDISKARTHKPASHDSMPKEEIREALEKLSADLSAGLQDIDTRFREKLSLVEENLAGFDGLRGLEPLFARLQDDLAAKLDRSVFEEQIGLKLNRSELVDLVFKSSASKDELRALEQKSEKILNDFSDRIQGIDLYTRKHKRNLSKRCEEIEKLIDEVSKRSQEAASQLETSRLFLDQMDKKMLSHEVKFSDLKTQVVEAFSARLRSLATTKTVNCLSCGKKDINYPPITELIKGETDYCYVKDLNPSEVVSTPHKEFKPSEAMKSSTLSGETQSKTCAPSRPGNFFANGENNRIFSAVSNPKSRLPSAQVKIGSLPKRQFSAADQVITREIVTKEHIEALHHETAQKFRPFSSIQQKPLFRVV